MGNLQFEDVIREHQGFVFRTLVRLTGSREHVEDLAQEVFLRLYRGMESFRGDAKMTTYLYRITLNVAQDEWRRRKKEQSYTSFDDPDAGWEDRLPGAGSDAEQILSGKQRMAGSGARAGRAERGGTTGDCDVPSGRIHVREDCRGAEPAAEYGADASAQRTEETEGTASGRTDGMRDDGVNCEELQRTLRGGAGS